MRIWLTDKFLFFILNSSFLTLQPYRYEKTLPILPARMQYLNYLCLQPECPFAIRKAKQQRYLYDRLPIPARRSKSIPFPGQRKLRIFHDSWRCNQHPRRFNQTTYHHHPSGRQHCFPDLVRKDLIRSAI